MNLKRLYRHVFSLTPWQRDVLASLTGTSARYLGQLARGERHASADLAGRLEDATGGAVKRVDVCEACSKCPYARGK